jgi:hypothetical protein
MKNYNNSETNDNEELNDENQNIDFNSKNFTLSEEGYKIKGRSEDKNTEANSLNKTYYFPKIENEKMVNTHKRDMIDNIHFFFNSIKGIDGLTLSKFDFYLGILISNVFTEISSDDNYIISIHDIVEKLPFMYDNVNPPLNLQQRDNYLIWRYIPREGHTDLLSFIALELHKKKFGLTRKNRQGLVDEITLKKALSDFGWKNLPSRIFDLSKRGYNRLRKRQYNGPEAFRFAFLTHLATADNERGKRIE